MSKFIVVAICLFHAAFASTVEVTKISPKSVDAANVELDIEFQGRMVTPPHFVPFKNTIAIKWPNANLEKSVIVNSNDFEISNAGDSLYILYKKSTLRPSDISKLSLKLAGNSVKTNFPIPQSQSSEKKLLPGLEDKSKENSAIQKTPVDGIQAIEKKSPELVKNTKDKKDKIVKEDYLSYLLSSVDKESEKNAIKKNDIVIPDKIDQAPLKDKISVKSKTPVVNIEKSLSTKEGQDFTSYIMRIVLVLGFLIGAILILAKFSKKIMIGKNKLGFLNNSKVVEILNTTYIAPKRQLLLVKVHDQVMLLANSESGLSFVSEVKDLSNLLKNAEAEVVGTNFDTGLDQENSVQMQESRIVLKDNARLFESTPVETKSSKMRSVLKNKAKSLKAWQ